MPPIPRKGSSATAKITMPTPPRPLSIDRHSKIESGRTSKSVITVAPVVLKPDIASNKASAKPGVTSDKIKGSVASSVSETQLTAVSRYPCCNVIFSILVRLPKNKDRPINSETIEDVTNNDQFLPVSNMSTAAGISMASPRTLIR